MENRSIEIFFPVCSEEFCFEKLSHLIACDRIKKIYLWCAPSVGEMCCDKVEVLPVASLASTALFKDMALRAAADCVIYFAKELLPLPSVDAILRMCDAMDEDATMLYCNYEKVADGVKSPAPTIDYQEGSLRNDFDFGSAVALRTTALKRYSAMALDEYDYAGFYQLRLAMSRLGSLQHLDEYLYVEEESDNRKSGEKQFDYVNPAQRNVQIEMEQVCTHHQKEEGYWLASGKYNKIDLSAGRFPVEASVVIPVLNREATIGDAISSVLRQKTNFKFNILVVDNHSTDGTGGIIDAFGDERVCHIVPDSTGLGIGGCWNLAVKHRKCGRFAVQLDSDDLYSDENTLQRVVDGFYEQQCAMLIGSYRICDFDLNTLPPGVIDHREWTEENGRNNALRINGLGAPRAFFTPVVRKVGFPNVSYGEDYAVGLQISRNYRIGRIYDVLYLCRRWGGNSDAALSHEKVNAHNTYKDGLRTAEVAARKKMVKAMQRPSWQAVKKMFERQMALWSDAKARFDALGKVETRVLENGIILQHNPARMVSTGANVDKKNVAARPCFLCAKNRPRQQIGTVTCGNIEVLVNPFPILPYHLTLPTLEHTPQVASLLFRDMLNLARRWKGEAIFYNGAKCGASAPDHAHLQAVRKEDVPILDDGWDGILTASTQPLVAEGGNMLSYMSGYVVPLFTIEAVSEDAAVALFERLTDALPVKRGEAEPRMNILTHYDRTRGYVVYLFPRAEHRPAAYSAEGDAQRLVSPGLLDMAGLMITPRREDFERITAVEAEMMLAEVALGEREVERVIKKITG